MLVIIITVISQGTRIPANLRGDLQGSLFINSGIFQAIGVISFGKSFNNPHLNYRIYIADHLLAFVCRKLTLFIFSWKLVGLKANHCLRS